MQRVSTLGIGIFALFAVTQAAWADDATAAETAQLEATELSAIADAHAQIAAVLPPAHAIDPSELASNWLYYGGFDGQRFGGSAYAGVEWSPLFDRRWIVRAFASGGLDDFRSGAVSYRSETARVSILPGYHFQAGTLDVKLLLGGDYAMRMAIKPALALPEQFYGGRASIDVWWEPAENWMVSGSASATTIESGLSTRLASGWRLPFAWIGPELLAIRDIFSTQVRAGAHLTGFKIGGTEWSVAGGYVHDSFGRGSPYGRIGVSYRP